MSNKRVPKFRGKRANAPFGIKMKQDMRDALKAIAEKLDVPESDIVNDILDEGLYRTLQEHDIDMATYIPKPGRRKAS